MWSLVSTDSITLTEQQTDIAFSHEDLAYGLSLFWSAFKITNNTNPWFILLLYAGLSVSFEVDVPTGKVGCRLLFEHLNSSFKRLYFKNGTVKFCLIIL